MSQVHNQQTKPYGINCLLHSGAKITISHDNKHPRYKGASVLGGITSALTETRPCDSEHHPKTSSLTLTTCRCQQSDYSLKVSTKSSIHKNNRLKVAIAIRKHTLTACRKCKLAVRCLITDQQEVAGGVYNDNSHQLIRGHQMYGPSDSKQTLGGK